MRCSKKERCIPVSPFILYCMVALSVQGRYSTISLYVLLLLLFLAILVLLASGRLFSARVLIVNCSLQRCPHASRRSQQGRRCAICAKSTSLTPIISSSSAEVRWGSRLFAKEEICPNHELPFYSCEGVLTFRWHFTVVALPKGEFLFLSG